jgi:hypothetical protein
MNEICECGHPWLAHEKAYDGDPLRTCVVGGCGCMDFIEALTLNFQEQA